MRRDKAYLYESAIHASRAWLTAAYEGPTIVMVRFHFARFVALWLVLTVITSAVETCIPGTMASAANDGTTPDGGIACAMEAHHGGPGSTLRVSGFPADCCRIIEPLILTKPRSLAAPVRRVLHWLTPAVLAMTTLDPVVWVWPAASPPPRLDSVVSARPPRHVVLRTFLI